MRRGRQVEAARPGLEVVGVECVRPDVAVPADDVERVAIELVLLQSAAHAHEQPIGPGLIEGLQLRGPRKSRCENGACSSSWP